MQGSCQGRYRAFGITLCSELLLSELNPGDGDCDLSIRFGTVALPPFSKIDGRECVAATEAEAWFLWENAGRFLVRHGREIIIEPDDGVEPSTIRQFLLGSVLAMAMHQRWLVVLHGSAVSVNGRGFAFVGDSGQGKSTTAAALVARGHLPLADDIVAIDLTSEGPVLLPAFPELNLWSDVSHAVGFSGDAPAPNQMSRSKRQYRFPGDQLISAVPLAGIYRIEAGSRLELQSNSPSEGTVELFNNSFGPALLPFGTAAPIFQLCSRLATMTPVLCLTRTMNLADLPALIDLIEERIP